MRSRDGRCATSSTNGVAATSSTNGVAATSSTNRYASLVMSTFTVSFDVSAPE